MSDDRQTATGDEAPAALHPALRDAAGIAQRIEDDQAAADRVREHVRLEGLQIVNVGEGRELALESGEFVVSVRRPAFAVLDDPTLNAFSSGGTLYLTDRRLIFVNNASTITTALADILELSAVGERQLLIALPEGTGVTYELNQPRAFRVEVSEAMAARRAAPAHAPGAPVVSPSR